MSHPILSPLLGNLETVIQGKTHILELVLLCAVAGGHVLLEDVPGTGKTTLARALAQSAGASFKRIQFTPDLLPGDILGSSIFHQQKARFRFRPGPIFTHILIADEINRASPRTQSALLEALAEGQVSTDGKTRLLPSPFLCIATQNPIDQHGTYPLPEASLDRFMVKLTLGYPPEEDEQNILTGKVVPQLQGTTSLGQLTGLQREAKMVHLDAKVAGYIVKICRQSRTHPGVQLGISTRGALHLTQLARARALYLGRDFVTPDDIKALAPSVLSHRLVLDARSKYAGADPQGLLKEILNSIPVPR